MKTLIYPLLVILLVGCNIKTKQTEAQFNRAEEEVIEDLKKLHDFEDAHIRCTENQINGYANRNIDENIKWTGNEINEGIGRNLKVYLKNGKNLPETNSLKAEIGKEAMQLVLNAIENDTDYEEFTVVFVYETMFGNTDMRSENPFKYKLEDFN